jgi:hypothetical protein
MHVRPCRAEKEPLTANGAFTENVNRLKSLPPAAAGEGAAAQASGTLLPRRFG